MRSSNVQLLWIDAHCIRQDTCAIACTGHTHCTQKRDAVQAIDLVYQLSEHPVALLSRAIQKEAELHVLTRIVSGDLVDGDSEFRLSRTTTVYDARKALWLLRDITQEC